ncbi:hypothetical protein [Amycolatopsis sp. CA-230715]|uniref:hypothetical protein n=1 Tax=Amycolatopsis sp. CA-230715 TaxID=2745196 RepID=UPI001C33467E|nr:hypothetical protein [Amycolatopsis sp. CA-230715]QWF80456.1 hypothetical protein HUW46_03878 [Amycolatopsis sp. CA-230715]
MSEPTRYYADMDALLADAEAGEHIRLTWSGLAPLPADGLACVVCGQSYIHDGGPHRPVGRDAVTGSQVFACTGTCFDSATADLIAPTTRGERA